MSDRPEPVLASTGVEARSLLAQYLRPSVFPASVDELVTTAEAERAPASAVDLLRSLPRATYRTTNEVWVALGGTDETRPSPTDETASDEAAGFDELAASDEAAGSGAEAAAPPWPERLAEACGALVTNAVKLALAVPAEVGACVGRLVRRS